ncbi:MAG: TIM44-like domain-containing protein [Thauera sp.]|jgi:predicted lipid-binding transport protein (Tim44 family)|nr:TIM44-like domain-containing protein [Thauera sp.]
MKHFLLSLFVAIIALGFHVPDAEAKRLGGGSSFGMKRNVTPKQAPSKPAATPAQPAGAGAAAAPKRSWMGPIAGLAAGLGLAALFSHLGLGEGMANMVMLMLLVAAAVFAFRMFSRRRQQAQGANGMQYAGAGAGLGGNNAYTPPPAAPLGGSTQGNAGPVGNAPADFDAEGFARQAKLNFIRLQTANDKADVDDLRQFTTPEVFAELSMQLSERAHAEQRTDIIELNAEVVDVEEEAQRYIVSVRFSGSLRESSSDAPSVFDEIWHLTKPVQGSDGWRVAGIQQA